MELWTILHVFAWSFGLKVVAELRAEFDPRAKTWAYLTAAVWNCLAMEVAMLGVPYRPGLSLVSVLTGLASGVLILLAYRSYALDMRSKTTGLFERPVPWKTAGTLLAAVVLVCALPEAVGGLAARLAFALKPAEGTLWLLASGWLCAVFLLGLKPAEEHPVFASRLLAFGFFCAFLQSALGPLAWLSGRAIPGELGTFFGTLFVLTLVAGFYAGVFRLRGRRLAQALADLERLEDNLYNVEKLVSVGTFAAGAAHDFNNALTSIMGLAELSLKRAVIQDVREDLEGIIQAARSAAGISERLVGIARRSSAASPYATLCEAVGAPLVLLEKDFAKRGIRIVKRFELCPKLELDLGALSQVCLNLYLNARDAMKPKGGGALEVAISQRGEAAEISVSDTGTGIPADFRARIFESFQTTKGAQGTGLGLSVSHAAVAKMGGRMSFESEEGRGTTFRISLPLPQPAPRNISLMNAEP